MAEKENLPITVTFEIFLHPAPNERWFDVTPLLTNEEAGYSQGMNTCLVTQNELGEIKEATCLLIGRTFDIREVKEVEQKERRMNSYELWQACKLMLDAGRTLT